MNSQQRHIALLLNANAATNRRRGQALCRALDDEPSIDVHLTHSLDELDQVADALSRQPPDVIAIAGGDGTLSHGLSALRARLGDDLPPLTLVRGGSMNMVAESLRVPRQSAAMLLAMAKGEELVVQQRDCMRVEQQYGFIFGLGLVPRFLSLYYEGEQTGPWRAAVTAGQVVGGILRRHPKIQALFEPSVGHLQVNEEQQERAWSCVLAQTISNLGLGFKPCYRAESEAGAFHLLASDMPPAALLRHLPYIYQGRAWPKAANMIDQLGQRLQFFHDGVVDYVVDGEIFQAQDSLEVNIAEPVSFFMPKRMCT